MLKKAKKGKIWNEKFWFQNLKKRSFCVFCVHFIVTELSEALQKKAISLLTGGAVDHLQKGNRSPKGRLFTWLQKNWRHTQELVQISYINSEKPIYNSRPKSRVWYSSTVLQLIKRSIKVDKRLTKKRMMWIHLRYVISHLLLFFCRYRWCPFDCYQY